MRELVEDLKIANDNLYSANKMLEKEIERLNNIIDEALKKSRSLQYRFGYVLDDLIYLLMRGSDKE